MKFVIAVVMLALAVGAHSSLLAAQIAPGVSYINPVVPGSLLGLGGWAGPTVLGGPATVTAWGGIASGLLRGIPGISLSQGPLGAAIAAPIAAPLVSPIAASLAAPLGTGPGVYVAKTRGAIHTAPLPGHLNSATSVNVAPAPGTW
ncbi:adult cuticle protein 1-like [Ceratitis capitata]|uniref:adult cuticle protein 1-like n=1 Tax=Ceratitis capitata TaxID=7213 RepID=UPI00032993BC|nr:adult cuticle protein 1-like [Ceratitis capitata]